MSERASMRRIVVSLAGLTACAVLLPGCLINSRTAERSSGTYISENTLGQIEPGVTSKAWVLGALGEPTKKTTLEDGSELWKWEYSRTRESHGGVLFLINRSSSTESGGAAYVEMRGGVVTKAWKSN